MKISKRWLCRWIDVADLPIERLRDDLTMSTAEVEAVHRFGHGLDDVVVGHVVERRPHPGADRLSLTRVDVGSGEALRIVCGAPNVAAGQRVAVVLPGGALPDGTRIAKARIRGEESFGMICSERELGLSDAHEGILVLPDVVDGNALRPGARLTGVLPVTDDVLEIDNKSVNHRPDLWGHLGFARELAAIYGRPLLRPATPRVGLPAQGERLDVAIEDLKVCPRYTGLLLQGVRVGVSPPWLRWLLRAVGQRPIHDVVDLTNFVMLDLGQPMHAFDRRRLHPSGIAVRKAREGEVLTTLDGVERSLRADDLLITSGGEPVALAGIMGGAGTMVEADTTELFLESANFHPATIRRTSTRLGLRTDASARFEKALDPALAEDAVHAFVALLGELCPGARAAGPLVDPAAWRYQPRTIRLRQRRLERKLGVAVGAERTQQILTSLSFDVRPVTSEPVLGAPADGLAFDVAVPSFRATKDVTIEDDLVEEIGRMFRYDNIPEQPLVSVVSVPPREPELQLVRTALRIAALEGGFHEVYDYTFVPDAVLAACRALDSQSYVRVTNPVAPEVTRIRRHVLPSLLANVAANLRLASDVRLVQQGKGYWPERRDQDGLPHEVRELAFVHCRTQGPPPWPELAAHVRSLLRRLGRTPEVAGRQDPAGLPWVHPGRTAALACGGTAVGWVGVLHPAVARHLELPETTAIATLDVRAILAAPSTAVRYQPLPRFPEQPVDVALLVDATARAGELEAFLRACAPELVRAVELFEIYRGPELPAGRKSVNFTVTLGAADRTLDAADEERYLAAVRSGARSVGAELRG